MKICPVAGELLNAEGQTDRHDGTNSRFSQLCESTFKKHPAFMLFGLFVSQIAPDTKLYISIPMLLFVRLTTNRYEHFTTVNI